MILKCTFPKYVHFNGLKLRCALLVFFHLRLLGFKNEKKKILEGNKCFSVIFVELKYR